MKKLLALMLAVAMVLSMVAVSNVNSSKVVAMSDIADVIDQLGEDYDENSAILYDFVLSDFYAAYEEAKAIDNASEAWAKMAMAEAKLLEAGVMLPLTTRGGNYAISRVAPGTVTPILYGNDQDRFQNCLITTEFITAADRAEMKQHYNEVKGTGTYLEWAKNYLTEKGYTLTDTYGYPSYTSDPKTWDYMATSRAADSEAIVNGIEMLLEYDVEGVQQPALATGYTVSDDGLTYTFTIREGCIWVDSQGRKVADVKADDFVAGFQHMLDAMGGLEFLVDGIIAGAHEYINQETTDFSTVGVKALDDYTLEYTLEAPCRYFVTMLGYNPFAPMSREYYVSQGGKFGEEYDPSAETYTYGTSPNNIAYVGPYVVTNFTSENTIVFQANESYWNADNVNIKNITWVYNDGSDVTKGYNDAKAGIVSGIGLTTNTVELAKQDGLFDTYAYISSTEASSFMGFMNINRTVYANTNDEKAVVSPKTEEQAIETAVAMLSQNFRLALCTAWDRAAQNAQKVGEELKLNSLRNSYTPGNFVTLTEDVTVDLNGESVTFPAGTNYGEIMQAQITADGYPMVVYDPTMDDGAGSSDGFDGWYNPDAAMKYMEAAVAELAEVGIEVSAENPITIDLPYPTNSETYVNSEMAVKKSVEASLGGLVVINLVECVDYNEWYYAGYYTDFGYEANYDSYDLSGWGPDYGDPATYLDTFLPDYAGYMIKCIGIY
ncbi:MAG: ABC transporter substrate-binding protein [Faecousia sp.]